MPLRLPLTLLSPPGRGARLSILIFHRVVPVRDPLFPEEVDAAEFDRVCGWLASMFRVLRLDEAVGRLQQGTLPARAACITFDDGYADNRTVALPILQRHGLTATFYIASRFLDGGRMWNDTVVESVRRCRADALDLTALAGYGLGRLDLDGPAPRRRAIGAILKQVKYLAPDRRLALTQDIARLAEAALPDDLMMRASQVRELHAAGMLIGAHTATHPILARLTPEAARHEIATSRLDLEAIIGAPVRHFAYPNGKPGQDYSDDSVRIVRELGFDSAVSTAWGAADRGSDLLQLPRFTPWDRSRTGFGLRMLRNLWSTGSARA